jgi:hypothetical protein
VDVVVKLYYKEIPNEKLKPPSIPQALMDKAMDQVQKDHTSALTKHLLAYDPTFGPKFLKHIQVHYNMNSKP